jgi:hypothetical protein
VACKVVVSLDDARARTEPAASLARCSGLHGPPPKRDAEAEAVTARSGVIPGLSQCESRQQTGLVARRPWVTPPKIHSPSLLCPYPPATIKSAFISSATRINSA